MDLTLGILDIKEREIDDVTPPAPPTAPSATGFPAPKKRVSAFKAQRQGKPSIASASARADGPTASSNQNHAPSPKPTLDERRGIEEENKAMLDSMSPAEIAEAQKELYNGMDPKFLQMLLRRANLDEPTGPSPFDMPPAKAEASPAAERSPAHSRHATVEDASEEPAGLDKKPVAQQNGGKRKKTVTFDEDAAPPAPPPDLIPVTSLPRPEPNPPILKPNDSSKDVPHTTHFSRPEPNPSTLKPNDPAKDVPHNTHFPRPPTVPDLDPSDPDFLESLHKKYFPNLPADPSKLAWMAPIPTEHSAADRESPYYPGQDSLPVSALRFDFTGALLSPRVSREIPVTAGLHHHGEAPEAAGYTIPELAGLARSSYIPHRCMAYVTLGRLLYRLGRGDWGEGVGGRDGEEDDLAFALWRLIKGGRVVEGMEEMAALPDGEGHLSCKAYAVEALWLLQTGGWSEKWRGL